MKTLNKITQQELNEIIRRHQLWVDGEDEGIRADLSNMDLHDCNFEDVILSGANCKNTNFRHANLTRASFGDTNLENANFKDANLFGTTFFGAKTRNTNFENTIYD